MRAVVAAAVRAFPAFPSFPTPFQAKKQSQISARDPWLEMQ